jgi:biopolymer transport protein ExbB/TolQ
MERHMNQDKNHEFIFQLAALLVAVIVVHALYVTLIRPTAAVQLAEIAERVALDENYVPERSLFIVLKDLEQETCVILMLWAMAIMGMKARELMAERRAFGAPEIHFEPGRTLLPEDARGASRQLDQLDDAERQALLPRAMRTALGRFQSTGNVQDVATAIREVCETENDRLDSELSMIRYIAWAIPSIGFIGTVRGIGEALGQANRAVEGDITGVTESLGVAFNSTFVALVISILLMFLMYQLQLMQERLVLDAQRHMSDNLIPHLKSA